MDSFASHAAHKLLAKLIKAHAVPPEKAVTRSAHSADAKIQVVVIVAPWEPMHLEPGVLEKINALNTREQPAIGAISKPELTGLKKKVYDLLSDKPAKCAWLAAKLGKNPGGSFRSVCSTLVHMGLAEHIDRQGYVLKGHAK